MTDRQCENGCGCRYGTDDADRRECGCDGPCTEGPPSWWAFDAVQAERERIAGWLEAKAAEMGDHEIPFALRIAAQTIRNGSYARMLELQDPPGT